MNPVYYPAFLNLEGKKCIVVGGGKVAERKVASLLKSRARVLVISPDLTATLMRYKAAKTIRHSAREYRAGDLKGAFLVIAATSDDLVNRDISRNAGGLVNVVDVPELANFILPAVVNHGPLTIAVSTGGASPAMAASVRRELEQFYSADFGAYLMFLGKLRKDIIEAIADKEARESFFIEAASAEVFDLLRAEGFRKARNSIMEKLRKMQIKSAAGPVKKK